MFTRELEAARKELKIKGYSYRRAMPELGVSYQHICLVLTGKRQSRRLLNKIAQLKPRKQREFAL